MNARILAPIALALSACAGGPSGTDASTGSDAPAGCGPARFADLDHQCRDHVGCQSINETGCGCRCVKCDFDKCVEQSCSPACPADAGATDAQSDHGVEDNEAGVDSLDGGHPDAPRFACEYVVDRDASILDADWDAGVLFPMGTYGFCGVNDQYVFLADYAGSQVNSKKVSVIALKGKKKTDYLSACTNDYDRISSLTLADHYLYWNRKGPEGADVFRLDLENPMAPTRLTFAGQLVRGASSDAVVSGAIHFDGKGPETVNFLDIPSGTAKSTQFETEPFYGYLWDRTYVFSADYREPAFKYCLASYDFDSNRYSEHFCSDAMLLSSIGARKAVYVDARDSSKYGHPSTDIFVFDLVAKKEIRVTDDEASQWCPGIFGNLVVYKDFKELGNGPAGPEGPGRLWVYDLETGARRMVPVEPMDGCPEALGDRYIVGFAETGYEAPVYLIDMVNAGIVNNGHVVPE